MEGNSLHSTSPLGIFGRIATDMADKDFKRLISLILSLAQALPLIEHVEPHALAQPQCGDGNCGGNGICLAGKCICYPAFAGRSCEQSACSGSCSGHGSCLFGGCTCDVGWSGPKCNVPTPHCPHDCSGHGRCPQDASRNGICQCDRGYTGADCSRPTCPVGLSSAAAAVAGDQHLGAVGAEIGGAAPCSGHGRCDAGTCVCAEGYAGHACEIALCVSSCHGHGHCASPGRCVCSGGWSGPDCTVPGCPGRLWQQSSGRWEACTSHGECLPTGECECDRGWIGAACDEIGLPSDYGGRRRTVTERGKIDTDEY